MQLFDLPEEILILIIRRLDLCSLHNLYNTCKNLRSFLCVHGVLKECCMSHNVMATVHTLKLDFIKDISHSLQELNMCGVPDLSKTAVLPAMRRLKNLKVLDISFTNLDILDFIEIHKVCPTITDISINLRCGKYTNVPKDVMVQCQEVFEQLTNVNFIGSFVNLLRSKFAPYLVAKSKLHHLKYTAAESSHSFAINDSILNDDDDDELMQSIIPDVDQFTAYIMNWKFKKSPVEPDIPASNFPVVSLCKLEKYEYIVIHVDELDPKVFASPTFNDFFRDKFHITVEYPQSHMNLIPNSAVMVWNKLTTKFDDCFYRTLTKRVKEYFPYYFVLQSDSRELPRSSEHDWFYTIPTAPVMERIEDIRLRTGRRRVVPPKLILNYDVLFKEKRTLQLTVVFQNPISNVTALKASCDYLKKLTYFSLVKLGRYSYDFFNVLFRTCVNLHTLNVEGLGAPTCTSAIGLALPLSQSLKNLRIIDKSIDFSTLFIAFTQCATIENVHIVDESLCLSRLADPSMVVEQCKELYSVYLEATMTDATRKKTLQKFSKAKATFNRHNIHVNIKVFINSSRLQCCYDTYVDVFRLNPIRPVKV